LSWDAGLQPWLRPYARALVEGLAGYVKVTSVYRSFTDQLGLWLRRNRNPYPVAPPGSSKHQQGRAWDMTGSPEVLRYAGQIWESWGGRWGGEADPIHFEA